MGSKIFNVVLGISLLVCLYFIISLFKQNKDLEKLRDNSIEELKKEKEQMIDANYKYIDSLKNQIKKYDVIIKNANLTIDSLENRKDEIKIVYIERIKEIRQFNSTELNNYWSNEF